MKPTIATSSLLSLAISMIVGSATARGAVLSVFPMGAEGKSIGIESANMTSSVPSVMYNPAVLARSPTSTPYLEAGLVRVNYSYEHPDFDPVIAQMAHPIASAGGTIRLHPDVGLGFAFFPAFLSDLHLPGIPMKLLGSVKALDIKYKKQIFHYAAGMGFRVQPHLSLGISVIHTREKHEVKAGLVGDEDPLVTIDAADNYNRLVVGAQGIYDSGTAWGASYTTQVKKTYSGKQTILGSSTEPMMKHFDPAIFSLGVSQKILNGRLELGLNLNQYYWEAGRSSESDGINDDPDSIDLKDVQHRGFTLAYLARPGLAVNLGVSDHPSPWGDGVNTEEDPRILGVSFGNMEGINYRTYSAGLSYDTKKLSSRVGVYRAFGTREVGTRGSAPGYYQIEIATVTSELTYRF